ncbi:phage head closure protein [Halomonas sp. CH40]
MRAGELRYLVAIQKQATEQDPMTGEMIVSWITVGYDWASIEGIKGREYIAASAPQAEVTYRVKLRYRPDLYAGMRLIDDQNDQHFFEVTAALPDKRRRKLKCMCILRPASSA